MWTIIICAIIGIFIGLRYTVFADNDFYLDAETVFISLFIGLLSGFAGALVGVMLALALPTDYETVETKFNMETLQDNGGVEGSFFLGCGTIDSKMVYVFYYGAGKTEEGDTIYRMGQIDADEADVVYINRESDEAPHLIKYVKQSSDAFMNNFSVACGKTWYRIYVPKGTIQNGYSLDAK